MKQNRLLATKHPYELDSKVAVDFGAKHVIFASEVHNRTILISFSATIIQVCLTTCVRVRDVSSINNNPLFSGPIRFGRCGDAGRFIADIHIF